MILTMLKVDNFQVLAKKISSTSKINLMDYKKLTKNVL
jgi:hypothetical protein